jgi:hypothetical protein
MEVDQIMNCLVYFFVGKFVPTSQLLDENSNHLTVVVKIDRRVTFFFGIV